MKYREFTDIVKEKLGDVDYNIIYKAFTCYKPEFLIECLKIFPITKLDLDKTGKARYFLGICKKEAISDNFINSYKIDKDVGGL